MSNNEKYREAYDMLCEFREGIKIFVSLRNWNLTGIIPCDSVNLSKWLLDNKGIDISHKSKIYLQDLQEAIDDQKVSLYNPVKNISRSKYVRCTKTYRGIADTYQSSKSGCVWMYKSFCNKYYYWADYNAKNEVIYFRGEVDWVKDNYEVNEDEYTTDCEEEVLASFSVTEDAFDTGDLGREEEYVEVVECPEADKLIAPKNDDFIDFSDHNEFIKDVPAVKRLPVKSDGGKSSYYEVNCPQWFIDKVNSGSFMVEDLAEIMYGNDFNYTNILKAQKRMYEMVNGGGKEGNTLEYDATKCKYYIDKQLEIDKRGE